MKKEDLILFTGGHSTPALAVMNELQRRDFSNFIWVGNKYNQTGNQETSAEYKTVTGKSIKFIDLKTGKLVRKWNLETFLSGILNVIFIGFGFIQSATIILQYKPKLILSFGGYLAVPIVIWGKILGSKVITHEQTITTGLANKIIGRFADKILVSWEDSIKYFQKDKVTLTGNPIRSEVFETIDDYLTENFEQQKPLLYITGGNQGANEMNKRIFEILDELLKDFNIVHQTGSSTVTNDYKKAINIKNELPDKLKNSYMPVDYVLPTQIGDVMGKADIVFSRAGANIISEILALGKLAILMPIPWTSHDEQTKNAEFVARTGLGYVLRQNDSLTAQDVKRAILQGLENLNKGKGFNSMDLKECIDDAKGKVILNADKNVADIVVKLD